MKNAAFPPQTADGAATRLRAGAMPPADNAWKRSLAAAVRDPAELLGMVGLPVGPEHSVGTHAQGFAMIVPRSFVARMKHGDPADPLLRQVLPVGDEDAVVAGYGTDPLREAAAAYAPGVLKKYAGRVLVIAAGICAINCRYCFRRAFPYDRVPGADRVLEETLAVVRADDSIREVILSGGDPLVLGDTQLERWVTELAAVPHVTRVRIHSRLPIALPDRVNGPLVRLLRATRLTPVIVVHANHPNELEGDCAAALTRIADAGVPVLNQAVLLRGVNDDADTLARLCERLVALRVMPYYLHQLDPVRGAAHFHVPEERGRALVAELRARLPGYAVPRYVKEEPGAPSKTPLG